MNTRPSTDATIQAAAMLTVADVHAQFARSDERPTPRIRDPFDRFEAYVRLIRESDAVTGAENYQTIWEVGDDG